MAKSLPKVATPKAVKPAELGLGKQAESAKGPFGGGNKFHQLPAPGLAFTVHDVKGHNQKKTNVTPVVCQK